MKKILILLITFLSLSIQAQTNEYEVISYLEEGFKAPNTNYLGEAWLNQLIRSDESLSYNITKATFKGLQKCKPFFIGSHCSTRLLNNLIFIFSNI
jgi:hypothetical protein